MVFYLSKRRRLNQNQAIQQRDENERERTETVGARQSQLTAASGSSLSGRVAPNSTSAKKQPVTRIATQTKSENGCSKSDACIHADLGDDESASKCGSAVHHCARKSAGGAVFSFGVHACTRYLSAPPPPPRWSCPCLFAYTSTNTTRSCAERSKRNDRTGFATSELRGTWNAQQYFCSPFLNLHVSCNDQHLLGNDLIGPSFRVALDRRQAG